MGQSMAKPSQTPNRNGNRRLSARSLHRQSYKSNQLEKRASYSASKMQQMGGNEQNSALQALDNTQIRNGLLNINSTYQDHTIKTQKIKLIKINNISNGGQTQHIPRSFKQLQGPNVQYGLDQWIQPNSSKENSSFQPLHQDITISFNKGKQFSQNFHQKNEDKEVINQQKEQNGIKEKQQNNQKPIYLQKEIDGINSLKSIISQNSKSTKENPLNNTQKMQINKIKQNSNVIVVRRSREETQNDRKQILKPKKLQVSSQQNQLPNKVKEKNATSFNDYDTDFQQKNEEGQFNTKNTSKLPKKLQELKEKIANRASISKQNSSVPRFSFKKLSNSFQTFRNSCSLQKSSRSKNYTKMQKIKQKLSKTDTNQDETLINQINNSPPSENDFIKIQQTPAKITKKILLIEAYKPNKKVNPQNSKQLVLRKIKSSQSLQKPKKITLKKEQKQTSKLRNELVRNVERPRIINEKNMVNNEKNQFNQKQKVLNFTQMVKKEHFNNKVNKNRLQYTEAHFTYSQLQQLHLAPIEDNLFASNCESKKRIIGEKSQLIDTKQKLQPLKFDRNAKQLKKITEQIHNKNIPLIHRNSNHLSSNNNSTREQSSKNKTNQNISNENDLIQLNFTSDRIHHNHCQEYMLRDALGRQKEGIEWIKQEKKKSKSSQHSHGKGVFKNKLIIF